jgi:regulator of RNase E activity RraA
MDGIVFLPFSELDPTLEAARFREKKEKETMQELRNGKTTVDLFNLKIRK